MQKEVTLILTPKQLADSENIYDLIAQELKIDTVRIKHFDILKRSLDARKKPVIYRVVINAYIDDYKTAPVTKMPAFFITKNPHVVSIIGSGPAGLFAALELLKSGVKPVVFERGKPIHERKVDVASLNKNQILNSESNYCFGEGGAGTFSDGKLYTRSKKKGDIDFVLQTFVAHGAPEHILFDAAPHLGTDLLPRIIKSMRTKIIEAGGEVHFNSKLTDFTIVKNRIKTLVINAKSEIPINQLILASGHSARDIYALLAAKGIAMMPKPFALGVRVEHPQELINTIQYHGKNYDKYLPSATYKLVEQVNRRGVFSFCMCPGGLIVPSATENNQIVVNGMSNSKRNGAFANSGIVVQVDLNDINGYEQYGALALLKFQEDVEASCSIFGINSQVAPAQRMVDFCHAKLSSNLPSTSYFPGVKSHNLKDVLPDFISEALKIAFPLFDKKMRGFFTNEAIIIATESRTSAPVRIVRDKEKFNHIQIQNLYPCGEGAGYAGGITSSAIDGINAAKAISCLIKT